MLPGDRILGRFEIVRALVRNAERPSTFRVRDLRDDRQAILKLVRTHDAADDPLQDEVALLRALPDTARQAHIAPLLDSGHDDGVLWMLTEDAGEVDVGQHLARRPDIGMAPRLGFDEVLDLLEAVGTALALLHRHRVLHLDVKEANIVVDPAASGPDRYCLVDLGIGRQLREGRSTATADLRGTLEGVAPELLHPSRQVGPPADVYSLCAVALRSLRARPQEKWPVAPPEQIATCGLQPENPRHLALLRLLLRGMDERAGKRPSAAGLLRGVRGIRRGRVFHARMLRPLLAVSPLIVAAMAALTWWYTAPVLSFDDASEAWGLAGAAPDAMPVPGHEGISSGFFWYPSIIRRPDHGNLLLHVPRGTRYWGETSEALTRDLFAEFVDGRFQWRLADIPETENDHWWVSDIDLDGDGALDRLTYLWPPSNAAEYFAWFGPDPWTHRVRSAVLTEDVADDCLPGRILDNGNLSGLPFVLPAELGGRRPRVLVGTSMGRCVVRWSRTGYETRQATEGITAALAWFDLQSDGLLELFTGEEKLSYLLSEGADGAWTKEPLGALEPYAGLVAAADIDADGDDDLVAVTYERDAFVLLLNVEGRLQVRPMQDISPLDPGEENWESPQFLDLVDLDGDGLPELVLQACGFPRNGAASPKLYRNLGGGAFERIGLPASLAEPHDGTPLLVVDVDQDGLPDLLDLSINDDHREVPTHRAWRTRSRSRDRLWSLDLRLPGGAPLPLGSRLQAAGDRPWLHVVRDEAAPVAVPSWLEGDVLVQVPSGVVHVLHLARPLDGPSSVELTSEPLPPLYAAGGALVEPGRAAVEQGRIYYHARHDGLDISLLRSYWTEGHDRIRIVGGDQPIDLSAGPLRPALGCYRRDRCLFMEPSDQGGLVPLQIDPISGEAERLDEAGDMVLGAVVRGDRAWVDADHKLSIRDPETYALIAVSTDYDTSLGECRGLGVSGDVLACATHPAPRLILYDARTLEETARYDVPVEAPWSVVPVDGGWALTTEDGMAWFDGRGELRPVRIGEPLTLVESGDILWAVGEDRALWFDPSTRRILGGVVSPGVGATCPVGPEGEHGHR